MAKIRCIMGKNMYSKVCIIQACQSKQTITHNLPLATNLTPTSTKKPQAVTRVPEGKSPWKPATIL